jgi:hypothetical protein
MFNLRNSPVWCAGLFATVFLAFGQSTGITTPYGTVLQLPPLGLAASETAQVNVVNIGIPPANGGVTSYCNGTIVFSGPGPMDSVLGNIGAFSLQTGQMFSAPLPFTSANAAGPRTVIRATIVLSPVKVPGAAGPVFAPCSLAASFETYDTAAGVAHAVVTASAEVSSAAAEAKSAMAR